MEDDGFELVKCKRRHARLKRTALASVSRIEGTVDDIQAALEKTNSQLEDSGLSSWIINKIRQFLGDRRISCVYLIGNGHFDAPWEAGTHQLALTRRICRAFDTQMLFQEPCISNAEREWLSRQDGIVLRDQPDVCLDILGDDQSSVGIAVVLHGVHGLLNDFLSFNWRVALHRILLLCNDYRDIDLIGGTIETNSEFPALNFFRRHAKFVAFPEYSPNPSFFHHTSLAYLDAGISLPELATLDR